MAHEIEADVHLLVEESAWRRKVWSGNYVQNGERNRMLDSGVVLLVCKRCCGREARADPAFKSLDGQTRKLSVLRGQVVVVNFWATWCGPCQEELPRLSRLAVGYAGTPVRFVLVSIDEAKDRAKIPAVLGRLHVSLESWDDADTNTMERFGLGDIVPGTAVMDENGEVVARIMGEAREEDVRERIDWLLGGKVGTAPAALTKRY
jgi:thiol-disulfide isomerase/thioredoxin